ncbi:MAG: FkbM family methyltransferase [Microcoleaceae cyanobacterium MO_207.B10]|nr:FkbM family methyltransferase [Microcoleaceae cyanobacterium MO_207.B10]
MLIPLTETTLPNGLKVFCLREYEVPFIYSQVQEYLQNGIELQPGDTVFDVGANIGLFTLWVHQFCHQNIKIYAFEPIPEIFQVLQANIQRLNSENLKVFPFAISHQSQTKIFTYYPNATVLSTAYPENLPHLSELLKQTVSVRCQLKTLSEIIREYEVEQIDLLKVDVEKGELEVLLGIAENDWQKIKQVVAEVHNLDSRVESITSLLSHYGFNQITIEQEAMLQGSDIFNLYAVKRL